MEGSELVEQDISRAKVEGVNLMQRNLSYIDGDYIRHNPDAIAASIIQLICDDLKFKDMQNDTQYMMLNDKLKNAKKSIKNDKKAEKQNASKNANRKTKQDKNNTRQQSKFFKKYQDRIESIKESELKLKQKEMKQKASNKK